MTQCNLSKLYFPQPQVRKATATGLRVVRVNQDDSEALWKHLVSAYVSTRFLIREDEANITRKPPEATNKNTWPMEYPLYPCLDQYCRGGSHKRVGLDFWGCFSYKVHLRTLSRLIFG